MSTRSSDPSSSSASWSAGAGFMVSSQCEPGPSLPSDHCPSGGERSNKEFPVTRGLLWYFPDACKEVARCSKVCNDQHNPGQPMHWARHKSTDHEDCIVRHLIASKTDWLDDDGIPHAAKVAWRALAYLQVQLERRALLNHPMASKPLVNEDGSLNPIGLWASVEADAAQRAKWLSGLHANSAGNPHTSHDQWRDLELDAHSPQVPVAGPAATGCPYADPDEERRRQERAKGTGSEPC